MKRLLATAALLAAASMARAEDAKWTQIDVNELDKAIQDGKARVYDTNPKFVWETRRVTSATWLDAKKFTAADLTEDKAAMLVFYCMNDH